MDPDVCYQEMTETIEEVDRLLALARERAVALHEWLDGGGAYPSQDPPDVVRIAINQVFLRTDEEDEEDED